MYAQHEWIGSSGGGGNGNGDDDGYRSLRYRSIRNANKTKMQKINTFFPSFNFFLSVAG